MPALGGRIPEQQAKFFNTQQREEQKSNSMSSKYRGGSYDRHNESSSSEVGGIGDFDLDFNDLAPADKPMLTLEELEQKYKKLNQATEK